MPVHGITRCLEFLRHRRWLVLALALLGGGGAFAFREWAALHHLNAAQAALGGFQNDRALDHLQQCLRVWPRSVPAHLLAARAERRAGRFAEAAQHLDECRKWADGEAAEDVAFEWALLQAAMGNLRSVEDALQARLLSRPADGPLIWEALAEAYRRTYRLPQALNALNTWVWFEPDNAEPYFLRGEIHRQVGAFSRAQKEFRRSLELDARRDDARQNLARCLVNMGHYQEAAQHLEILLRKSPGDPQLRTLLARTQFDLGQRTEAIRLLDEVLREHPEQGPALRERARLALVAENYADAEKLLRQALRVLPYDYEANFNLHRALQGLGRSAEAKTQLASAQQLKDRLERIHEIQTHAMTLNPFDPAVHAELGELLIQCGQRDSGEQWLLSAVQLDPGLPAAHAALARFYEEMGDLTRTAHHRREAERGAKGLPK